MASRSYLYVPADRADMLEKARGRGADALIVDLEDAVPHAAKCAGRRRHGWRGSLIGRGSAGFGSIQTGISSKMTLVP